MEALVFGDGMCESVVSPLSQAPLRQSENVKTALFASIRHELMTRVTVIQAAASNLKSLPLSANDRVEQSDLVLVEARQLRRLVDTIADIVRLGESPILPEPRWALPSQIIAAAQDQIERMLERHTIEIAIDNDAPVFVDPRLLAKALAHLLENAAQYAPPETPIRIDIHETIDTFEIAIADRGPGIALVDLPHVFDRSYRGTAGRSRPSGTGMGLWITRELLAAEGGAISVANRPGGGSVFTIVVQLRWHSHHERRTTSPDLGPTQGSDDETRASRW
jgi:two-component system, OmpR family, sensor histidine kinase KdpD